MRFFDFTFSLGQSCPWHTGLGRCRDTGSPESSEQAGWGLGQSELLASCLGPRVMNKYHLLGNSLRTLGIHSMGLEALLYIISRVSFWCLRYNCVHLINSLQFQMQLKTPPAFSHSPSCFFRELPLSRQSPGLGRQSKLWTSAPTRPNCLGSRQASRPRVECSTTESAHRECARTAFPGMCFIHSRALLWVLTLLGSSLDPLPIRSVLL